MDSVAVLPHVVRRAERLITSGENARACRLLTQALTDMDPVTARHDARLIEAAIVYADTLSSERDIPNRADLQLSWARYAESAARVCYGCSSGLWQQAADCYARVCAAQGLTFDAVALMQRKLAAYHTYGPDDRVTGTREQLATALHADGQCAQARTEIRHTFLDWKATRIGSPRTGQHLLITWAGILAGCGHTADARALLHEHAELMTADRRINRHAAALAAAVQIAMTERDHPFVCTTRPTPATATPLPASTPLPPERWRVWETVLLNQHHTPTTPDQPGYQRNRVA